MLHKYKFLLLGIVLVSLFLRLYHLPSGLHYTGDEGRDAIIAREIILGEKFRITGPPSSIGELRLGPLYWYMITPFLLLANMNPLGPALLVVGISAATSVLLYFMGKDMFKNEKLGMIAAWIFAIAPVAVTFGRWSWNPNIMPFFSLLFLWGLWKSRNDIKWFLAMGVSLGVVLQSHYFGLLLIPTSLYYLYKNKSKINRKYLVVSGGVLTAMLSPLIVYDLFRNFSNIKGILAIGTGQASGSLITGFPVRIYQNFALLITDFIGLEHFLLALPLVAAVTYGIYILYKSKKYNYLVNFFVSGIFLSALFTGEFQSHYLGFLWPVFTLLISILILRLKKYKYAALALLSVVMIFNTSKNINAKTEPTVSSIKDIVMQITKDADGKPFNFSLLAENNYDASYRYFFLLDDVKAEYTTKVTDTLYVVCEEDLDCRPEGNPKWEIALFEVKYNGQTERVSEWIINDYYKVIKFVPK